MRSCLVVRGRWHSIRVAPLGCLPSHLDTGFHNDSNHKFLERLSPQKSCQFSHAIYFKVIKTKTSGDFSWAPITLSLEIILPRCHSPRSRRHQRGFCWFRLRCARCRNATGPSRWDHVVVLHTRLWAACSFSQHRQNHKSANSCTRRKCRGWAYAHSCRQRCLVNWQGCLRATRIHKCATTPNIPEMLEPQRIPLCRTVALRRTDGHR